MARERLSLYDTTLRTAARPRASTSRLRINGSSLSSSMCSGYDYMEPAVLVPTPPTRRSSRRCARSAPPGSPLSASPGRPLDRPTYGFQGQHRRQLLPPSCSSPNWWRSRCAMTLRTSRKPSRSSVVAVVESAAKRCSTAAFLRRLQGQPGIASWSRRPMRSAPAGSCSATPMAARCRKRSRPSWRRWPGIHDHLGIHVHNNTDNGIADSLAAVRAGARPDPEAGTDSASITAMPTWPPSSPR